jgi:hypothetical protein
MINVSSKQFARLPPVGVTRAALTLVLLAVAATSGAAPDDDDHLYPDLGHCQNLHVRPGNKLILHALGVGVQIYQWNGSNWEFVAPEAVLFGPSEDHGVVGIHFAGPTWMSVSGSRVVGAVVDHCTPNPDSISWLLLSAALTDGNGVFEHVSFIQRLHTVGGKAPSTPGHFTGQMVRVPYTADYYFYRATH